MISTGKALEKVYEAAKKYAEDEHMQKQPIEQKLLKEALDVVHDFVMNNFEEDDSETNQD